MDNDLTQQDVADICGVSDATVGHWETGRRDMKIDSIIKLCRYYKISADYIFDLPKDFIYPDR
ncbi:MAG: helix-turn-helix domain-containing protein [Eubacterium sp.]|nr:helix-turn-helix domain-containing protein [Eubacterium sp.]